MVSAGLDSAFLGGMEQA